MSSLVQILVVLCVLWNWRLYSYNYFKTQVENLDINVEKCLWRVYGNEYVHKA
jgi:hypothetical protein